MEPMKNKEVEYIFQPESLNANTAAQIKDVEVVSIFVTDLLDKSMIQLLKIVGIKFLITRSAGMDHIDLDACKKMGITSANIPDYGPETIAEHALMLTLCLLRKWKQMQINMNNGDFRLDDLLSETIFGKTVGVLGTGRIGSRYAKMMHALGANLLGFDLVQNEELENKKILRYVALNELFREAEIISLHLPLTEDTRHFFSTKELNRLEKKPWIINTARGGLVDTKAILHALQQKKISGYATDVYENEDELFFRQHETLPLPDPLYNELMLESNVLVTPHLAFAGRTAINNMMRQMHETIQTWALSNKSGQKIQ